MRVSTGGNLAPDERVTAGETQGGSEFVRAGDVQRSIALRRVRRPDWPDVVVRRLCNPLGVGLLVRLSGDDEVRCEGVSREGLWVVRVCCLSREDRRAGALARCRLLLLLLLVVASFPA